MSDLMPSREFNDIAVSEDRTVLRKTSDRVDALAAERNWYRSIPHDLRRYTPTVHAFSEQEGYLELEYIDDPCVGQLFLFGTQDLRAWNDVYDALFRMLDAFRQYTTEDDIEESLREMYVGKTQRRLDSTVPEWVGTPLFEASVTINGRERPGVPTALSALETSLEAAGLFDIEQFAVIHGDPCFSNVFVDPTTGSLTVVDPRGAFGSHTIYGDPRYDIAKMRHSAVGGYEFIINDRFDVEVGDGVCYEIHTDEAHVDRERLFRSRLMTAYPDAAEAVRAIESLLWLSMVPLHSDAPDRQTAMLAKGLEQFDEEVRR